MLLYSRYEDYDSALETLNLDTLSIRRDKLCLRFSKKCMKYDQTKEMFPLNLDHQVKTRYPHKFKVNFARAGRPRGSSIPQMQGALNDDIHK